MSQERDSSGETSGKEKLTGSSMQSECIDHIGLYALKVQDRATTDKSDTLRYHSRNHNPSVIETAREEEYRTEKTYDISRDPRLPRLCTPSRNQQSNRRNNRPRNHRRFISSKQKGVSTQIEKHEMCKKNHSRNLNSGLPTPPFLFFK